MLGGEIGVLYFAGASWAPQEKAGERRNRLWTTHEGTYLDFCLEAVLALNGLGVFRDEGEVHWRGDRRIGLFDGSSSFGGWVGET